MKIPQFNEYDILVLINFDIRDTARLQIIKKNDENL